MANATEVAYQEYLKELQQGCHAYRSDQDTAYKYVPSFAAGIVLSILFAIPFFYHTFQSIRLRASVSILLALGALSTSHPPGSYHLSLPKQKKKKKTLEANPLPPTAELIGWAARAYNGKCPYNRDAFMSQIVTLIIAPVFFSAALYVLLGKLIVDLGRRSSVLTAKWYAIVFCTCDVLSLIIQAIGGAKASLADTDDEMNLGTHIMVAGIVFQLFTMTLFGGFGADFLWRVLGGRRAGAGGGFQVTRGMKLVFAAIFVSFLMIYVRSIYRTIELLQGWHGYILTHEGFFIGLDAATMVVAVGVFVAIDPAVIFRGEGRPGYAKRMARVKEQSSADASDAEIGLQSMRY